MAGGGQTEEDGDDIGAIMDMVGHGAVSASRVLASTPADTKNKALMAAASTLRENAETLIAENKIDMEAGRAKELSAALMDRLELNADRIEGMAKGLEAIAALADPVGEVITSWEQPSGLKIERVRMPLGVIGVIYESRPNVTADAGALCLKAGNACIWRVGPEGFRGPRAYYLVCIRGFPKLVFRQLAFRWYQQRIARPLAKC